MAHADGIDELDDRCPIRPSSASLAFIGPLRPGRHRGGYRDSDIDGPLDARLPVAKTLPPSGFWEMAHLRPDRAALAGLAARARADEATYQETFVVAAGDTMPLPVVRVGRVYPPLFEDALAHEFTEDDRAALVAALEPEEA